MGGWNDAIVTEAEPRILLRHSADHAGRRTTKTLEFVVLLVKKMMDSRTVGCRSSAYSLGWELLFEESTAEASSPKLIPGAIHDCADAGKY